MIEWIRRLFNKEKCEHPLDMRAPARYTKINAGDRNIKAVHCRKCKKDIIIKEVIVFGYSNGKS